MYKVCQIIDETTKQRVGHDTIVVIESRYEKRKNMLKEYGLILQEKQEKKEGK